MEASAGIAARALEALEIEIKAPSYWPCEGCGAEFLQKQSISAKKRFLRSTSNRRGNESKLRAALNEVEDVEKCGMGFGGN
jgi:hypothetical protein